MPYGNDFEQSMLGVRVLACLGTVAIVAGLGACEKQGPRDDTLAQTREVILRQAQKARMAGTVEEAFVAKRLESAAEFVKSRRSLQTPHLLWADLALPSMENSSEEGLLCVNWVEGTDHACGIVLQLGGDKDTRVLLPVFADVCGGFIPQTWTVKRIRVRIENDGGRPALVPAGPRPQMDLPVVLAVPKTWVQSATEIGLITTSGQESNVDSILLYSMSK